MISKEEKLLSHLQNICARREYCEKEIFRKALDALDGDEVKASELLTSLVSDRFVDNKRYAEAFARDKSSLQGWGPIKIKMALRAKSISESDISSALEGIDGDKAEARLEQVLRGKWKSLEGDPQGRLKLIRFALSRGYEYEDVASVSDRITRR